MMYPNPRIRCASYLLYNASMNRIDMDNVTEYCENERVQLVVGDTGGHSVVIATNEGGYNSTQVDVFELLAWFKAYFDTANIDEIIGKMKSLS